MQNCEAPGCGASRLLSREAILVRLENSLGLWTGGSCDLPDRQPDAAGDDRVEP